MTLPEGVAGGRDTALLVHQHSAHSFGSYRLAESQDAAKTSYEMGNGPQMVFAHYRELA